MQIWRILQTEGKPDAWVKEDTDPFPLPRDTSLNTWVRDRFLRDLRKDENHPEYWVVFSPEEKEAIEKMVSPLAPAYADQILNWLFWGVSSLLVSYISPGKPIGHQEENMRLAIHMHRKA